MEPMEPPAPGAVYPTSEGQQKEGGLPILGRLASPLPGGGSRGGPARLEAVPGSPGLPPPPPPPGRGARRRPRSMSLAEPVNVKKGPHPISDRAVRRAASPARDLLQRRERSTDFS